MSTLISNRVTSPEGNILVKNTGSIIQVVTLRTDTLTSYISVNNAFVEITPLRLTITPKYATSRLIIQWEVYGEFSSHDSIFRLYRDGALITTVGEEGYNSSVGSAVQWSSFYSGFYDSNDNSTPNKHPLLYSVIAGSTVSRNYGIAFSSSNTTSTTDRTFRLNRSYGRLGENQYENGISTGVIYEVAQ